MASGPEPADAAAAPPVQVAAQGGHWWPAALPIVVAAFLHVALPVKHRVNQPWVAPAVLLALLAALIIGNSGRTGRRESSLRIVTGAVIAFLTAATRPKRVHGCRRGPVPVPGLAGNRTSSR